MGFVNFKGIVKKVNLKSPEETEVTISISASELEGQYNILQSMLEQKVMGGLDSQIVTYKILKNAVTGKPITRYAIDSSGVVSVAKPEGEQLSLDLGLPPERIETKEEPVAIELNIINDFILSGMAPDYDDLDHDFIEITGRLSEGDTYLKLAGEEDMGVGIFVMMVDEYRKRVAPLAAKWDEWRKGKVQPEPAAKDNQDVEAVITEGEEIQTGDTPAEENHGNGESEGEAEPGTDACSDLPDWMQEDNDSTGKQEIEFEDPIGPNGEDKYNEGAQSHDSSESSENTGSNVDPSVVVEIDNEVVEEFILTNRPIFPDIALDFPNLLEQRRKEGKTWMILAAANGVTSGQLNTQWKKYKDRVKGLIKDGGAA
ncbi:hypothetical protein [Paenibacillus sp. IHBB 10380]|uniref:hypothetical protein n=1 Tax=Paenibacillus sp. IHBB 10380 TaxID=1566358 RepID=UPI0006977783|nr:hypothetical protein [Paenibacillus sp. IHBB 10380]